MAAEQRLVQVVVERETAAYRARANGQGGPHLVATRMASSSGASFMVLAGGAEVLAGGYVGWGVSKSHRLASGAHRLCGGTAGGAVGTKGVCRLCLCLW